MVAVGGRGRASAFFTKTWEICAVNAFHPAPPGASLWDWPHHQTPLMPPKPRIAITYCAQCRFVLRATWLTQELLMTFGEDLGEVALIPAGGGIFEVHLGDELLWSKKGQGRFPDSKELKQLVR